MVNRWVGLVGAVTMAAACGGASPTAEPPSTNSTAREGGAVAAANPADGACGRRHPGDGARRLGHAQDGSAVAMAKAGASTLVYVADEDDDAIHTMDITTGETRATTRLPGAPSQLVVLEDGRVAVALRSKNRVVILEPPADSDQALESLCSFKTPVEPVALALTPDEDTLVVTSGWARKVTGYAVATQKVVFNEDLPREPRSVVVAPEGDRAFVAHVVGGKVSVVDLKDEHAVREIDLRVPKTVASNGNKLRESCQGFALAKSIAIPKDAQPPAVPPPTTSPGTGPESTVRDLRPLPPVAVPKGRVFAPRVTIDPGEPTRRSSGYGSGGFARIESSIVSVIDTDAERNLTTALLEPLGGQITRGDCLLPRAAAVSASTGGLLVTCMGTNAVVEMDPRGTDPARLERRRWSVAAGPTGVAVDDSDGRAVVWSQFDRQLAVIDLLSKDSKHAVETLSAPRAQKAKLTAAEQKGRKLFHQTDDQRISRDGRACASCHPDGREDALTWSTPVGPRQTIMLAGRLAGTGPFSWLGAHESIEVHLNTTFQRLGGSGLAQGQGEDLQHLIAYIKKMDAPSHADALVDSRQAELVKHGEAIFYSADTKCADCHVGGATDAKTYDLGTRAVGDRDDRFDTPSLKFVAGTAPYFHDGRYASLLDVLMATDSKMGHSMHLSRRDALALEAYLETL